MEKKEKTNIVLIGMPAAGKSTAGVILAKVLGKDFIDTDLIIQHQTEKKLSEIIAGEGIEGFLEIENSVIGDILAENSVIATGGSAVYGAEAMEHLKKNGVIVYLEVAFPELSRRLMDIRGRGVVLKEGQTLKELYEERVPLYRKYADITVTEIGWDAERLVAEISEAWRKHQA